MSTVVARSALLFGDGELMGLARACAKRASATALGWSVSAAGYDSWQREILDPASAARRASDQAWVFVLSPRVLEDEGLEAQLESVLQGLAEAASPRSVFFGSFFADPTEVQALSSGAARAARAAALNARLGNFARQHRWFHLLDVASFVLRHGYQNLHSARYEAMARYVFQPGALDLLADWVLRHLAALDRAPAKVIAVDFDNTLWGGILGEDGAQGLRIGSSGSGLHHARFQSKLKALKDEGFLLVALSKNNADEAEALFRSHADMRLKWEDFSAHAVNWQPKAENLSRVAAQLGLGEDAFLFIDDSAHEREEMHARLPQVRIFPFPADAADLCMALADSPDLDRLRSTAEDRQRASSYAAEAKRAQLSSAAPSLEDYYRSLELKVDLQRATPDAEERLHQLLLKTNQFNLATERPEASEFRQRLSSPGRQLWAVRVSDRVGDSGLTGLVEVDASDTALWKVESFLLSCRVLGRTVEFALLSWLAARAQTAGAKALQFRYRVTGRNQPALDFLARIGARMDGNTAALDLSTREQWPAHFATLSGENTP
jgi:FkbH-like protein